MDAEELAVPETVFEVEDQSETETETALDDDQRNDDDQSEKHYKKYSIFNYKKNNELQTLEIDKEYQKIYKTSEDIQKCLADINQYTLNQEGHEHNCIFSNQMDEQFKTDIVTLASKLNTDDMLSFNILIDRYFGKYLSMYSYIFGNTEGEGEGEGDTDKAEIEINPITREHYPFSQEDLEDINQQVIVCINFDNYCTDEEELPDTSLNNLIQNGKTQILHLTEYSGTLENLPSSIKCLSVNFAYYYFKKLLTSELTLNNNSNEDELDQEQEQELDQEQELYELAQKYKTIIEQNTLMFGNVLLNEGLEWLEIHNRSYINLSILPRTLKGLIIGQLASTKQDYYYRDYVDFPPNLEVLSLKPHSYSKVICPDRLKILELITDLESDVDIDITIPDTLERLIYFGNTNFLKTFPSHLKTLQITITNFEFIHDNIPLGLEELSIRIPITDTYDIDLLVDIISRLNSLKILIINITEIEILSNFETNLKDKLATRIPTYKLKSIKMYFPINISDNAFSCIDTLKNKYCMCM
jgi:hypothetical protein